MKEKLIKLGFEKWLGEQELAPYPVMFWDIPKFIQLAYIQKFLRENRNMITEVVALYGESQLPLSFNNLQKPISYFYWDYYDIDFCAESAKQFENFEDALEAGIIRALEL